MSIMAQRLNDYKLQMGMYTQQHQMLLASDVLDMIEQLQDDLKDDTEKAIAELKKMEKGYHCTDNAFQRGEKAATNYVLNKAIEIVKGERTDG